MWPERVGPPAGRPVRPGSAAQLASIASERMPTRAACRTRVLFCLMPTQTQPIPTSLRIIPRDQHNISRKDISPNALRVLYRLRDAGFQAYLVGGAVRDLL